MGVYLSDYDCFYASVIEAENPALKSLPLAIQQKQIIVTCNYVARRRGLKKLQLIKEAKKICPDVVIVLGEDLTRFRDASKDIYSLLETLVTCDRAEKLGFDEVFLDVTSIIDYNIQLLNQNDLSHSFFQLDKLDPAVGFTYDAAVMCGPTFPSKICEETTAEHHSLLQRLILGSHLANYLRLQIEERKGYTSTAGISTSKLLAKLVGNLNKPHNQTTIIPPYFHDIESRDETNHVTTFMDSHEIGKIPGIGFKIAARIRTHLLGREPLFGTYTGLPEADNVTVGALRTFPNIGPSLLNRILSGDGWPKDIGIKIWSLINGIDNTEVALARRTPTQISIEDSYGQLDKLNAVQKELISLTCSLIRRMHTDLTDDVPVMVVDSSDDGKQLPPRHQIQWLAHPRTLRLSTRLRPLPGTTRATATATISKNDNNHSHNTKVSSAADPSLASVSTEKIPQNSYTKRSSRSCYLPRFVFSSTESVQTIATRLTDELLLPMFRKLHSEKSGWNIGLINVAVTNMVDNAGNVKTSAGRDIGTMFRTQDRVLRDWKVVDTQNNNNATSEPESIDGEDLLENQADGFLEDDLAVWDSNQIGMEACKLCGALIPYFAAQAHANYHSIGD
ncbi:hypothetical protein FQN57_000718 [Myotisia sp. PD_48]|nr:hypothetical protein FQN57_000718 [Myotisia sp. PD_48]